MNRREFSKQLALISAGAPKAWAEPASQTSAVQASEFYLEPAKRLPARRFDVVVAGAGTAGVVAALAAARQGARTLLIEQKGCPGGTVTEGGTALHSFYNLWKAFPGVTKRQVVRGIPQEIIDRLQRIGGTTGHVEMSQGYDYDSVCCQLTGPRPEPRSTATYSVYSPNTWAMVFTRGYGSDRIL
jgi:choline dehydrogenase-like flavoprotein